LTFLKIGLSITCVVAIFVGWYQGERIRDGERERGWFGGGITVEILSAHVRGHATSSRATDCWHCLGTFLNHNGRINRPSD
jgi:hypothetical protein